MKELKIDMSEIVEGFISSSIDKAYDDILHDFPEGIASANEISYQVDNAYVFNLLAAGVSVEKTMAQIPQKIQGEARNELYSLILSSLAKELHHAKPIFCGRLKAKLLKNEKFQAATWAAGTGPLTEEEIDELVKDHNDAAQTSS